MNRYITLCVMLIATGSLLLSLSCRRREPQEENKTPEHKTSVTLDEKNAPHWRTLITSHIEKERTSVHRTVLNNRRETIRHLLSVLNSPVEEGEQFYGSVTSRNIAIFLLGKLRTREAVGDLTKWLLPRPGQGLIVDELSMLSPAGYALVEIGLPSVPALLEVIKSGRNSALREQCIKIIVSILGQIHTQLLFEDALAKETDSAKGKNLKAALDLLHDPKFEPIFGTCARGSPLE